MAFTFEKLDVYRKAVDFADRATALTGSLPGVYGIMAGQFSRTSFSIPASFAQWLTLTSGKASLKASTAASVTCVPEM